jgi:hypothetical protein
MNRVSERETSGWASLGCGRLRRWVQQQCRSLVDNDSPDLAPFLRRAAASLRARPTLFK